MCEHRIAWSAQASVPPPWAAQDRPLRSKCMTHHRPRRFACALAFIVGLFAVATVSTAQGIAAALPSSVVSTNESLTSSQAEVVNRFVTAWSKRLVDGGDASSAAEARSVLLEPLTQPGATATFKDQYSARLINAIGDGLSADAFHVRLNTMIVVAATTGAYGVDVAEAGLEAESAAIRYWAARTLANALEGGPDRPSIGERRQRRVHRAVVGMIGDEDSSEVREHLYRSLAAMQFPAARATAIDAIRERLGTYGKAGISADLLAEKTGLNKLYIVLVNEAVNNGGARTRAQLRDLAVVAYQAVRLIARDVAQGEVDDDTRAVARDIVTIGQRILVETLKEFGASPAEAPDFEASFRAGEYVKFAWQVNDWATRLTDEPLSAPEEQLSIPNREGGGDAGAAEGDGEASTDGR